MLATRKGDGGLKHQHAFSPWQGGGGSEREVVRNIVANRPIS